MRYTNVMRGADPELFLIDRNNQPVTSVGRIGGTKQDPRPIDGLGSAVQEDNVAVEFNIIPAADKETFINNIQMVLAYLEEEVKAQELALHIVPSCYFTKEQLNNPQAQHLGCDPDMNVWTLMQNPRPQAPPLLRSAGGHLHLSWSNPNAKDAVDMIKAHDLFCAAPMVKYDKDKDRRSIYGKAGAFRFKPYGVEHRTMSNVWISSKALMEFIYEQSEKAIRFLNEGGIIKKAHEKLIINTINKGDEEGLSKLGKLYPLGV